MSVEEHPFAQFVRTLGKGKSGTRSLDFEEAETAFGMVLRGETDPLQLGAFLMLLRVKEETPEELAGFVSACRRFTGETPANLCADLDWSSYAGKRAQEPWYLLSALLLAQNGVRVLMHGSDGHTAGRAYAEGSLQALGITAATSWAEAGKALESAGFAYLPLRSFCKPLDDIMQLKPILGLRSPVNTLARLLNPLRANYSIQSVFHPNYAQLHTGADHILGQPNTLVFKGDGGEVEIKPQANTQCLLQRGDQLRELSWPRALDDRQPAVAELSANKLLKLWRGDEADHYGELAVVETCAAALLLLERADAPASARELANEFWQQRDLSRL